MVFQKKETEEKTKKKPDIHSEVDQETYQKAIALKEQKGFQSWGELLTNLISQAPILPPELLKALDSFFIEGSYTEKLTKMVKDYLQWHEKFPYLHIERELTPKDAGFDPQCPFVRAIYWKQEFLGFHCRAIKPPAFRLPIMRVEMYTLQITTTKDCLDCQELLRQAEAGIPIMPKITLQEIDLHKKAQERSQRTQAEIDIADKLEEAHIRLTPFQAKQAFSYLRYDEATHRWKRKNYAANKLGSSRPTLDKLIKAFPKGIN